MGKSQWYPRTCPQPGHPRTPSSSPRQSQEWLRLVYGGRGPEPALDWANQRPASGAPPHLQDTQVLTVASQPVVKATRALKISFKEPHSAGSGGVVMTTGPLGPQIAPPSSGSLRG